MILGAHCQKCGAFVSGRNVLVFHDCLVFKETHGATVLSKLRSERR